MISDYNVNPDYCSVIKRCLPPLGEYGSAFEELHPHHDRVCVCSGAQSCQTLCDTMNCSPPGSFVHGNSPGKNNAVGSHVFLQGIFPTQGSNPSLPYCRWIFYHLSPWILEWISYPFSRGSSWPRSQTRVFCIAGRFFTSWATREATYALTSG